VRFKIDENLSRACAEVLRAAGYDAMTVCEQALSGASDVDLAQICVDEGRVLVTADLDLSDLRQFPIEGRPGYIVVRLKDQTRNRQVEIMRRILKLLATQPLHDRLWIVDDDKVRVRSLAN
jgi:predicted nuclease of predicted toxin-antitoxin system